MRYETPMLTKNEMDIMNVLWTEKRPLSKTEIVNLVPDHSFKVASIHNILNTLMEKGLICVDGFVRTTKNFARTFTFQMSREEFAKLQFSQQLEHMDKSAIPYLMSALIEKSVDQDLIDELQEMLDRKKEELEAEKKEK